jgi:Malectin domain
MGEQRLYTLNTGSNFGVHHSLHFAEIYWKNPGERLFDVLIEGVLVLDNYDIYRAAGHDAAISLPFSAISVQDGQLNIDFVGVKQKASVSAVYIQTSGSP